MSKKIILIGPVYPYKGGISHYTGLMYRELAKRYNVEMISYKMQYPKFLFHKEQKDYSNDSFKIEGTNYMLHTANPFNIIKTAHYIRRQRPDMVMIQWWHPYFAPCYFLLERFMRKQNIVFVCHNIFPHERFPMDKFLTRLVLKGGSHYIVHAKEEGREFEQIRQDADYTVTPHPTYNAFRFEGMSKQQARERLHIEQEERILLFFGYVREYKGLKYLLQAMPEIIHGQRDISGRTETYVHIGGKQEEVDRDQAANRQEQAEGVQTVRNQEEERKTQVGENQNKESLVQIKAGILEENKEDDNKQYGNKIKLWIVGEFGADREEYMALINELGIEPYVKVVDAYTPDREVEKYFAAADLVVLPYTSATQSGIVQIAYGFSKPVIVTEVGGLPDVVDDGKTGYVVKPESPEEIVRAVRSFYQDGMEQFMVENIDKEAYRFSWERMGDIVERIMEMSE